MADVINFEARLFAALALQQLTRISVRAAVRAADGAHLSLFASAVRRADTTRRLVWALSALVARAAHHSLTRACNRNAELTV